MKINKNQNRRKFISSSLKRGILTSLGIIGFPILDKKILSRDEGNCTENINCNECYKMGICAKSEAAEMRYNVKTNGHTAKKSKGAKNG